MKLLIQVYFILCCNTAIPTLYTIKYYLIIIMYGDMALTIARYNVRSLIVLITGQFYCIATLVTLENNQLLL